MSIPYSSANVPATIDTLQKLLVKELMAYGVATKGKQYYEEGGVVRPLSTWNELQNDDGDRYFVPMDVVTTTNSTLRPWYRAGAIAGAGPYPVGYNQ
jgi:hypothetical protein